MDNKNVISNETAKKCNCVCGECKTRDCDSHSCCECCRSSRWYGQEADQANEANKRFELQKNSTEKTDDINQRKIEKQTKEFFCPLYNKYCELNSPDQCSMCKCGPMMTNDRDSNIDNITQVEYEYYSRYGC